MNLRDRKSIDDEHYKIRFTPRNPNSVWSKVNVQKAQRLIERNQMRPSRLTLFQNRKDQTGYSAANRNIELLKKYEDEIKKNPKSWAFFNQLPLAYKRDSIWWIMSAKKRSDTVTKTASLN